MLEPYANTVRQRPLSPGAFVFHRQCTFPGAYEDDRHLTSVTVPQKLKSSEAQKQHGSKAASCLKNQDCARIVTARQERWQIAVSLRFG